MPCLWSLQLDESGKRKNWPARHKKQTLFESVSVDSASSPAELLIHPEFLLNACYLQYAKSRNIMDMRTYNNTLPHYDPQIDRYVLDLNARATMPRYAFQLSRYAILLRPWWPRRPYCT